MLLKMMFLLPQVLEGPVLFSFVENGPKWSPDCADNVPVRGARAGTSSAQLGHHFGFIRTRRGQKAKNSRHKRR